MAKQSKPETAKQSKPNAAMVTVILLQGHPHYNAKLKKQRTYMVSGRLAEKCVNVGHWQVVE